MKRGHRIGIDVGGTNTDAVLLNSNLEIVRTAKVATTHQILVGVRDALEVVTDASDFDPESVAHVMVSTTHATNALIERKGLRRIGVLRLGAPATVCLEPLATWPVEVRAAVLAGSAIVRGGSEFSGDDIVPLDVDAIRRFAAEVGEAAEGFAVTAVFSPVTADHELRAREIIQSEIGHLPISLSHEMGTLGLIERENGTVLNASLTGVTSNVVESVAASIDALGIRASLYIAQNDGTLMGAAWAQQYPALTIGSGPASSLRGGAFLSGIEDAIVVDIGGTSTDIGVLTEGHPRSSFSPIEIGGIRANFRMPDLISLGIGGGTRIRATGGEPGVGPDSVGARLRDEALVFGGITPTLTDAAVGDGRFEVGERDRARAHHVLLRRALEVADQRLADGIQAVRRVSSDLPIVAVGGGARLLDVSSRQRREVHVPEHHDVANAVGAATAQISREIDEVVPADPALRSRRLDEARERAIDLAIAAGADPSKVEIVDVREIPLAYLLNPSVRVRVRAAGPIAETPNAY